MSEETNEYFERSDLDFLRDVLVDALESKRDNLIPRLFKLYEEVRDPAPTIPSSDMLGNINISTTGFENPVPGGDVVIGGFNDDVISFGDYKA